MKRVALVIALTIFGAYPCIPQSYHVERKPDGPFAFKLYGVVINKGSSLRRESILFNEASCPVQLTRNSMTFNFKDNQVGISAATAVVLKEPAMAFEVRHILFDVFGRHMQNLSDTEVRDFPAGHETLSAKWTLFDSNSPSELLTTVTYIARVRLPDGTQWVDNPESLMAALGALHLEKQIADSPGHGSTSR